MAWLSGDHSISEMYLFTVIRISTSDPVGLQQVNEPWSTVAVSSQSDDSLPVRREIKPVDLKSRQRFYMIGLPVDAMQLP